MISLLLVLMGIIGLTWVSAVCDVRVAELGERLGKPVQKEMSIWLVILLLLTFFVPACVAGAFGWSPKYSYHYGPIIPNLPRHRWIVVAVFAAGIMGSTLMGVALIGRSGHYATEIETGWVRRGVIAEHYQWDQTYEAVLRCEMNRGRRTEAERPTIYFTAYFKGGKLADLGAGSYAWDEWLTSRQAILDSLREAHARDPKNVRLKIRTNPKCRAWYADNLPPETLVRLDHLFEPVAP